MDTPEPVTIELQEYYAWSAEGMDAMRAEIANLIVVFRRECANLLPETDDLLDPAMLDDISGLLAFLSRAPEGDHITFANDVAVLGIRHDSSNELVKVFARAQLLPRNHELSARFAKLFEQFQKLRKVRSSIVIPQT